MLDMALSVVLGHPPQKLRKALWLMHLRVQLSALALVQYLSLLWVFLGQLAARVWPEYRPLPLVLMRSKRWQRH